MRIQAKVKASARESSLEKTGEREFLLRVKSPAKEGKANNEVIKILSDYFDIPKSKVIIIRGSKDKNKLIDVFIE